MLKVQQIGDKYRKMEEQYHSVCLLFCEDSKITEPSDFFNSFHNFIERYKRATREIDARLQEDKTLEKAEHLKAQNKKLREKSCLNAKLAAEVSKKRRSGCYDSDDMPVRRQRPMSENITRTTHGSWLNTLDNMPTIKQDDEFVNGNLNSFNGVGNGHAKDHSYGDRLDINGSTPNGHMNGRIPSTHLI